MTPPQRLCKIFFAFLLLSRAFQATVCQDARSEPRAEEPVVFLIERAYIPEIEELSARNILFRQYCEDRQVADKQAARGLPGEMLFYRYTAHKGDSLMTLASRLSLPIETLATVNAISSPDTNIAERELILPTVRGLFLPETPSSAYELLLSQAHSPKETDRRYCISGRICVFLQDVRLTPTERAFFLDTNMVMPLTRHELTSAFGYRVSPITGAWKFHSGVDLAAPEGSDVFACKTGTVLQAVRGNPVYGNYIILQHNGGMTSVYAHLSKILVRQGDSVGGGLKIGEVGTTGASTGPHLHFEVRLNGTATDPGKYLFVD